MIWPIKLSPAECRMLARDSGRPLTLSDIAHRAGLRLGLVRWIARQRTWDHITVGDAAAYSEACDVTPATQRRQIAYLKRALSGGRRALAHLRRLTTRQQQSIRSALSRGDSGASQATMEELKAEKHL